MRRVDELMVGSVGVGLAQMMENAGRNLADLALTRFHAGTAIVLAGAGNNGGGGLVAARHLANRGTRVTVVLAGSPATGSLVDDQLRASVACGVVVADEPNDVDLIVDALVGYGLSGELRGRVAELARWANECATPALALDGPSGLDLDSGAAQPGTVVATATLTLALPKPGLIVAPQAGELYLADISVPESAYAALGLDVPALFADGPVVRLLPDDAVSAAAVRSGGTWRGAPDGRRRG